MLGGPEELASAAGVDAALGAPGLGDGLAGGVVGAGPEVAEGEDGALAARGAGDGANGEGAGEGVGVEARGFEEGLRVGDVAGVGGGVEGGDADVLIAVEEAGAALGAVFRAEEGAGLDAAPCGGDRGRVARARASSGERRPLSRRTRAAAAATSSVPLCARSAMASSRAREQRAKASMVLMPASPLALWIAWVATAFAMARASDARGPPLFDSAAISRARAARSWDSAARSAGDEPQPRSREAMTTAPRERTRTRAR